MKADGELGRQGREREALSLDVSLDVNLAAHATPPRHIVAVVGLVRNDDGDVLMIDSPLRGWELPGGQVEEGETLIEALVREVREETGIDVAVGLLTVVHSNVTAPAKVILGFECRACGGQPTCSAESRAVEWVRPGSVLERIVHPAVAQRADDMLSESDRVIYRSYAMESAASRKSV